jgi:hypothetical protein
MVYDADGTASGELKYWVGHHIIGNVSCSLCDISHGPFRQKQVWKQWVDRLATQGIEVVTLHRNDLLAPQYVKESDVIAGRFPCVIAHDDAGAVTFLLGRDELDSCNGQVETLAKLLRDCVPSVSE